MPYDKDCNILFEMYLSHSASYIIPEAGEGEPDPKRQDAARRAWVTMRARTEERIKKLKERDPEYVKRAVSAQHWQQVRPAGGEVQEYGTPKTIGYQANVPTPVEQPKSKPATPAPMSGKVKSPIMITAGQKAWETRRLNNYRRLCDEMERRKQQG